MAIFDSVKAFLIAIISLGVILVCMSAQAVIGVTNDIFPFWVNYSIGLLWTTPFLIPALCSALIGVVGVPNSWPRLLKAAFQSFWPKESSSSSLNDLIIFGKETAGTLYKYIFFPLPFLPPADIWLFRVICREPCKHYAPPPAQTLKTQVKDEIWIYINGVATTKAIAETNRKLLFQMFGRPIDLLHNPTDSVLVDLFECAAGKTGLFEFGEIEPRDELKVLLILKLLEVKKKGMKKVVLISHSQGTIITGNAIHELGGDSPEISPYLLGKLEELQPGIDRAEIMGINKLMKEYLEVYNFATCAHKMPAKNVHYLENICNKCDLVAWLGEFFPFPSYWIDDKGEPMKISGKAVVESDLWGHLLNSHYLDPMLKGKYGESKLVKEYLQPHFTKSIGMKQIKQQ